MRSAVLLVLLLLVASLAPAAGAVRSGNGGPGTSSDGPTDQMDGTVVGGMNFTTVSVGNALFGIRYGTEAHPGPITIFARYPRFLGVAEIVDPQGVDLGRRAMRAEAYMVHRIDALIEFTDLNGNGLWDVNDPRMTVATGLRAEPTAGHALLATAWDLEMREHTERGTEVHIFTLTATDVPVTTFAAARSRERRVDRIVIEITLRIARSTAEDAIPIYTVHIDPASHGVESVRLRGERRVTAEHMTGRFKYNVTIDNWSAASGGNSLILLTDTVMGLVADRRTLGWAREELVDALGARGEATFDDASRNVTLRAVDDVRTDDDDDGIPESIQARRRIEFSGARSTVGDLRWVDWALVDGRNRSVRFCVMNIGSRTITDGNRTYRGIHVRGGFVYPMGALIEHDPGLVAQGVEVHVEDDLRDLFPGGLIVIQSAIAVAVAVLAVAVRKR